MKRTKKWNYYSDFICDCCSGQYEHVLSYLFKYNVFVLVIGEKVCVCGLGLSTDSYTHIHTHTDAHSRWSVREWLSEMVLLDCYVFMCTPRQKKKEYSGVPRLMFVFCRSACSVVSYVCSINTTGVCCGLLLPCAVSLHWAAHKHWCVSLVTKRFMVAESSVEPVFGVVYWVAVALAFDSCKEWFMCLTNLIITITFST